MKKTQIALALALGTASLSAAAQTAVNNVTLYGRVNTTVERQKVTGDQATTGLFNNASRWGVRGTEDLGGGMKALFQLESGFGSDTGQLTNNPSRTGSTIGLFNREAFAGLSGGFGTIRAGRITSPLYFASADYISMHNHDTGSSSDALFNFFATGVNNNNTVAYKTPSFSGADVEVAYSFAAGFGFNFGAGATANNPAGFNEQPGSANQRNTQIAVNWQGGPLHLGGGYALMNDKTSGGPENETDTWVIRALYEMGAITLGGYYERSSVNFTGGADFSRSNYRVSGMYTLGASEFHVNYGSTDKDLVTGASDTGATQWTLGYNYNLSKRTKVYGYYTQIDDDRNGSFYAGGGNGAKFSSIAAGLRHNF